MIEQIVTIYVSLLDEGVDVWRPVQAKPLGNFDYLILDYDYDATVETWEFPPGTVVVCEEVRDKDATILRATRRKE